MNKSTLKRHVCLRDAETSARKRSLFENLKTGLPSNYEVHKAHDGGIFSGRMIDFGEVDWPLISGFANGYRYDD
jgi:hypothetical protein